MTVNDIILESIQGKWLKRRRFLHPGSFSEMCYYRVLGLSHNGGFELWDYNESSKYGSYKYTEPGSMRDFYDFTLVENKKKIATLEAAYCKKLLVS